MNRERSTTHTADQRATERRALEAPVRMRLEDELVEGVSDNISSAGLMFFTERPLRVVVEIDEAGQTRTYRGKLVRAQRMSESTCGLAVELDPE